MSLPYYRWFYSDFYGDSRVMRMPVLARMVYRELLDISWQEGPIQDPELIIEGLGQDPGLWRFIAPCWTQEDEGWTQHRLEEERAYALGRCEASKRAGKASGRARKRTVVEQALNEGSTVVPKPLNANPTDVAFPLNHPRTRSNNQIQQPEEREGAFAPPESASQPLPHSEKEPRKVSRRPTDSQVRAAIAQHPELQALPGFSAALFEWRAGLPSKKRWKTLGALTGRLRTLAKNHQDAMELVRICTEEEWADPAAAVETLARRRRGEAPKLNGYNPHAPFVQPAHTRIRKEDMPSY